jgi:HSP20 family protein
MQVAETSSRGFWIMNDKDETQQKDAVPDLSGMLGLGGIFEGVSDLINKFGELAEKGESLRNAVNQGETSTGKKFTTSYGVNVQFGLGKDKDLHVKPMTKPVNSEPISPSTSVPRVREPHVEIFDEGDHVLVIAEMPGVSSEDVNLAFLDRNLHIHGVSKVAEFKKELPLPGDVGPEQVSITANNGVVEIRLTTK